MCNKHAVVRPAISNNRVFGIYILRQTYLVYAIRVYSKEKKNEITST